MPLSQTEAWYLGECLKGETLMCKKLANYRDQVQDPGLRQIVDNLLSTCRRHVDLLASHVR